MSTEERTRIVLVRHGESVSNVDRYVSGHDTCKGLSALGRRQAEALHARLVRSGELRDAAVLKTSILPRAIETAEIIAPGIGNTALVADRHCELCEIHIGDGEGIGWDEFDERYGVPERHLPVSPGSESVDSFLDRASAALHALAVEHDGRTVVAVCHGGIIGASLHGLGALPDRERPFDIWIENTSLTTWSRPAGDDGRWRLDVFNDVAHLAGL